jgi:hypothetical protein
MGCTYLLNVTGVWRWRRATLPVMKVWPQYLGCIMMSFTEIHRALVEFTGCSWAVPSITEYSLVLQETQKPTS